jgi:hypothetical protein
MCFYLVSLQQKVPRQQYTFLCLKMWKAYQENISSIARFVFTCVLDITITQRDMACLPAIQLGCLGKHTCMFEYFGVYLVA